MNLKETLKLEKIPKRIEVYDNSHIQGSFAVGAMIVANEEGLIKSEYRKFNIKESNTDDDFGMMRPKSIFVSATPGPWELQETGGIFSEQVIRPTGLIDPECTIKPAINQVDDLIYECKSVVKKGQRVLVNL